MYLVKLFLKSLWIRTEQHWRKKSSLVLILKLFWTVLIHHLIHWYIFFFMRIVIWDCFPSFCMVNRIAKWNGTWEKTASSIRWERVDSSHSPIISSCWQSCQVSSPFKPYSKIGGVGWGLGGGVQKLGAGEVELIKHSCRNVEYHFILTVRWRC